MANTGYYLERSTVTALLRDGLEGPALYSPEEPALSLSKGPALGSVSRSVSFVSHSASLVSHSASLASRTCLVSQS